MMILLPHKKLIFFDVNSSLYDQVYIFFTKSGMGHQWILTRIKVYHNQNTLTVLEFSNFVTFDRKKICFKYFWNGYIIKVCQMPSSEKKTVKIKLDFIVYFDKKQVAILRPSMPRYVVFFKQTGSSTFPLLYNIYTDFISN